MDFTVPLDSRRWILMRALAKTEYAFIPTSIDKSVSAPELMITSATIGPEPSGKCDPRFGVAEYCLLSVL